MLEAKGQEGCRIRAMHLMGTCHLKNSLHCLSSFVWKKTGCDIIPVTASGFFPAPRSEKSHTAAARGLGYLCDYTGPGCSSGLDLHTGAHLPQLRKERDMGRFKRISKKRNKNLNYSLDPGRGDQEMTSTVAFGPERIQCKRENSKGRLCQVYL